MPGRYLIDEIPPKPWAGQRCWIIGGGRSLKGFDFEMLRGENVIAINRAIEVVPFAEIFFSLDSRLYWWYRRREQTMPDEAHDAFNAFRGLKIWVQADGTLYDDSILQVKFAGKHGLSTSLAEGVYTCGNSGYAAVNLAVCLGANPIHLLGFDMDQKGNFHSGYPTPGGNPQERGWISGFEKLAPKLAAAGISVINMNQKSKLRCFPFGEIKRIERNNKWRVVSFYTEGTGYADEIRNLEKSLDRFEITRKFYRYQPQGSWRMNLNYKSKCILRAMREFPKNDIVFIDADGIVRKYPELFDRLTRGGTYDVAAAFHQYRNPNSGDRDELMSGTLWFQNRPSAMQIVQRWHEIGLQRQNVRHQKCLKMAIEDLGVQDRLFRLPFEYTYVFDYHYRENREPVIEHFQASRRFRSAVGYGVNLIKGQTT